MTVGLRSIWTLYKHKAICEYCKEQEFDGIWIRAKLEKNNFSIFVLDVLNLGLFRMIVNLFLLADLDNPLTTDT